jgi:hypothetical protein
MTQPKPHDHDSIGRGISWAGFWIGLGLFLSAETIASRL